MKRYLALALTLLMTAGGMNARFFGRSSDTPGSFSGAARDRWGATKERFGFGGKEEPLPISEPTGFRRVGQSHPTLSEPKKPGLAARSRELLERTRSSSSLRPTTLADYHRNNAAHRTMISLRDKQKAKVPHLANNRNSSFTWYEILNVRQDATPQIVESAYKANRTDATAKAYKHWLKNIFDPGRKQRLW